MKQPETIEELFATDPVSMKLHEAAHEMGKGDVFLQEAIKQGKCSFGQYAMTGENRWSYAISRVRFEKYLGTGDRKIKNMTPMQVAKIIGKDVNYVRSTLQQGTVPYGICIKLNGGYNYHISRKLFNEWWVIEQGVEKVYVVRMETGEIVLNDEADAWKVYDEVSKYTTVSQPEERRVK